MILIQVTVKARTFVTSHISDICGTGSKIRPVEELNKDVFEFSMNDRPIGVRLRPARHNERSSLSVSSLLALLHS